MSPTKKSQTLVRLIALAAIGPGTASADAVQDWSAILWTTTATQNPFLQARFAAITHLAMFEAVNAVTGDYQPYLGTVAATPGASAEAAAVAAAYRVLSTYFPGSALALDAARAASLAAIPDDQAETEGLAVGEAAAAAMIANRANDGSAPPQFYLPVTANPGEWQPTAGCPASGGVLRHWPNVTPFGLRSGDQFRSAPPPALTSVEYATDFNEVKTVGALNSAARPQDRTDVARFYAASPPTFVFSQVITQTGNEAGWSLSQNARAFALLMMAISDALVASQDTKYHYRLWRPVTAIQGADTDGNALTERDAAWQPLITTPCFPSYQSAHATGSNAARRIAERLFDGEVARSIVVSNPAVPGVSFSYKRFSEITADIDDARVYGGIHFRFDQKAGARQGQRVADYVFKTRLRPSTTVATSEGESPASAGAADLRTARSGAAVENGSIAIWGADTQAGSDDGNGDVNSLLADTGATSVIYGTAGPDNLTGTLGNDTINGLGGADVMTGLAGDDTYIVNNAADKVVEKPGEGKDAVRASVSYVLPSDVENLVLTGTRDDSAIGNIINNRITGNAGSNKLDGGPGNDTLRGGSGRDRFWFTSTLNGSTNVDRLTDFDVVNDKIVLYYRAFWTFVYADNFNSVLPLRQFHVGASATTSSHRIVYNPTTGALLYDRDGTGPIPAVRFAILPVGLAVTNLNFLVFPRYLR